ncbi:MAG: phosphoribosylamine--glycine ligase [Treponema sp.]|jgi:phosphoribosylamine--glycine ligase|nr:phosphoribosylamine--glycine ligase [Treponema sp.]
MKILVIGSGGREHAIAWKLAQSDKTEKIWAAPGNGGTAVEYKTENFHIEDDPASEEGQKTLLEFALKEKIDLAVVGPEAPLADGIVDRFRSTGLVVVGPDKNAARLEASKVYAKDFMAKYGVRTAKSRNFTDAASAIAYSKEQFDKNQANPQPLVIKADGLAAGKGVVIAASFEEAAGCLSLFMEKAALKDAGKSVVIEEFLGGREVSVLAAVSVSPGKKGVILPFIPARDHKNRFEWGKGPNTGGMGSIAPVPDFGGAAVKDFENSILLPTLKGMEEEKMDYRGFIFFGLMVNDDICSLLEYNVRLGDPETQAVLPLMDSDFAELCLSILNGGLGSFSLKWKDMAACAPVAVAKGYPEAYCRGDPILIDTAGLKRAGANLFIAGAQRAGGVIQEPELRTSGGRVLAVCALGAGADEARTKAYDALGFINFEGMDYRKDIGLDKKTEVRKDIG